jgi:hypothetical protein
VKYCLCIDIHTLKEAAKSLWQTETRAFKVKITNMVKEKEKEEREKADEDKQKKIAEKKEKT